MIQSLVSPKPREPQRSAVDGIYHWLQQDPEYRHAVAETTEDMARAAHEMAYERAVKGWLVPMFYRGAVCGTKRRYSDRLLVALLRIYQGPAGEANPEFADELLAEAVRRGCKGWMEPVFYKGLSCAERRRYSDTLLMAALQIVRPETYGPLWKERAGNRNLRWIRIQSGTV